MSNKFKRMVRSMPAFYKAEANTMIRGLLQAWAISDDEIEIQIQEAKNQIYVDSASGKYLDVLGNNVGVPRDGTLGLEDKDYRDLIPVLSYYPKQVRATLISLLDVFWGPGFTRANISSGNVETFDFGPQTTLTGTLRFKKDDRKVTGVGTLFTSEIQIGDYLKPQSFSGTTYAKVTNIINDTTLELAFPWEHDFAINVQGTLAPVRTLGYKVDNNSEIFIRFKPSAFEDITAITVDELVTYINSLPEHNQNITASKSIDPILGSKLNIRTNTAGLQGSIQITGGDANDVSRLNFSLEKQTEVKCSVYEINPNEVVVKIPSSVPVLRRSLKGSAHPKEYKVNIYSDKEPFNFSTLGASSTLDIAVDGNVFNLSFTHATDFEDDTKVTAKELALVLDSKIADLKVFSSSMNNIGTVGLETTAGSGEYQVLGGTANSILNFTTDLQTDLDIIDTDYPSSYLFDPTGQLFTVTSIRSELGLAIEKGSVNTSINLTDSSTFPNASGRFMVNFGLSNQEGPIRYNSRPNNSTLLIDASHTFQNKHNAGSLVNFVSNSPTIPRLTGDDYPVYIVGTEEARTGAQELIRQLLASGVVIRFVIEFPEYLFECTAQACCDTIDSPDHQGALTNSGTLTF